MVSEATVGALEAFKRVSYICSSPRALCYCAESVLCLGLLGGTIAKHPPRRFPFSVPEESRIGALTATATSLITLKDASTRLR